MARAPRAFGRTRVKRSGTATALVVLAVLSAISWLFTHRELHLGLAVVLVAAVVLDGALARWAVRGLSVQLRPPTDAQAGQPTRWDLQVDGWRRPVVVHPLLVPHRAEQLVDGPQPATLTWPGMRRGLVPFLVFDVESTGPLGLATAGRRLVQDLPRPLAIGPAPVAVDHQWPRPSPSGFGPVEGAPVGEELFRAIRPYRRGDDRRRVHWKATARHGELMVRELDGTGAVLVRIVVELGPDWATAEHTAGVASWVAQSALSRGWRVELITLDAEAAAPALVSPGRVFGTLPTVTPAVPAALPTVAAPVRTPREVQRRLATAAIGRPVVPTQRSTGGRTCHVGAAGVTWQ